MIQERVEVHLACETLEEYELCLAKLTEYGFECEPKQEPNAILAVKHLTLTKDQI